MVPHAKGAVDVGAIATACVTFYDWLATPKTAAALSALWLLLRLAEWLWSKIKPTVRRWCGLPVDD